MKKIGILTFHRSINYGAFMQCYALSKRIMSDFPNAKVEVIDYCFGQAAKNYDTSVVGYIFNKPYHYSYKSYVKKIMANLLQVIFAPQKLASLRIRQKAFGEALQFLPLSEETLITDDFEQLFKMIKNKYDVVVAGSDGIWEFISYPFPNAYFLNSDIGAVKMSYAASADRMHSSIINDTEKSYLKQAWSAFSYIGIRDVATENFIRSVDNNLQISHNCDPTILLDMQDIEIDMDAVKQKLLDSGIDLSLPIIAIMGGDNIVELVRELFGKKYQIVCLYQECSNVDCFLNDLNPLEWSKVFSLFAITFTRFFHGTILSLKNGTPTITLDDWNMVDEDHKSKLQDIYERLGLMEHYFKSRKEYSQQEKDEIKARAQCFIDCPDTDKILEALYKEAQTYSSFKSALADIIK